MIWGTDKYQKKRNGCGLIILCLLAVWFFIPPLCGVYFFPPYNEPILSGERGMGVIVLIKSLQELKGALLYSLSRVLRPAELHSPSAEENCLTANVASLRSVKVATPPCAAKAAIPCGLAVRKQHKMLFAASKFEKPNTENQTVDWSHYAKS